MSSSSLGVSRASRIESHLISICGISTELGLLKSVSGPFYIIHFFLTDT